jgi:catechol 2,3-dioxygenase-like lactoylglutathione lyase family enzyme
MTETQSVQAPAAHGESPAPQFHHIGIQTSDLDNSVRWYEDFFRCEQVWTLRRFSELTRRRLPGINALTEVVIGSVRIHLFERPGRASDPAESAIQFQHFCFRVDATEDLAVLRRRWTELYDSGRYSFALDDQPTEIVVDEDGVQSFYAYDVNGLEFEFASMPSGMS